MLRRSAFRALFHNGSAATPLAKSAAAVLMLLGAATARAQDAATQPANASSAASNAVSAAPAVDSNGPDATAAASAAGTTPVDAFPTPSPYPISWELSFQHSTPKRIVVDVPTSATPLAYWYMTYTITNNTDQEQDFLPTFELMTESGKLYRANVDIPPSVFDAIKNREHNKYLEPMTSITGQVRIGQAEARDGVAIWPEPPGRMGHFSIFVTGLSGEDVILRPVHGQMQKVTAADALKNTKDLIFLRKTLQLKYFIRGDALYPEDQQVVPDGQDWIMR